MMRAVSDFAKKFRPSTWAEKDVEEVKLGWHPGHPIPDDPLQWGEHFPQVAHETFKNTQIRRNLGYVTDKIRAKRSLRVEEVPDWKGLREAASNIKRAVAADWVRLLEQFEDNVAKRGGVVHWARDAEGANAIAFNLTSTEGVDEVVKVKSMATQEINLNEHLEEHGIKARETDLVGMIVQLSGDTPSHIVVPAIYRNRTEMKATFEARMEEAQSLSDEPRVLAVTTRAHLRKKFLTAKVALSGANVGVAKTGTVGIFGSEGNGRICPTLPETLITIMGIEKLVPQYRDIEVIGQFLPWPATDERTNSYTSFWTGVTEGDGPQEFHIILLDNGRTNVLADEIGREALKCIRCAACMNICPVYRHTGGHAYGSVYPGLIDAVLTPQLLEAYDRSGPASSLFFACSLCGACGDVCPVKINLPNILAHLRHKSVEANRGGISNIWGVGMIILSKIMRSGKAMEVAGKSIQAGRLITGPDLKISRVPLPVAKAWTRVRDVSVPPAQSFRQWRKACEEEGGG